MADIRFDSVMQSLDIMIKYIKARPDGRSPLMRSLVNSADLSFVGISGYYYDSSDECHKMIRTEYNTLAYSLDRYEESAEFGSSDQYVTEMTTITDRAENIQKLLMSIMAIPITM